MFKLTIKLGIAISILSFFYIDLKGQGQLHRLIYENDFRVIDSANYEIFYRLEFVEDTLNSVNKLVDEQVLQIGSTHSKYFSKLLFRNDSINTVLEESNALNLLAPPKGAAEYEIVRNRNKEDFEVTYRSDDIVFRYSESIPNMNWTIYNEKKTVEKYSCQKATVYFRGRKYVAWFTMEIPISEGPYKFGGLPGLILEIQDTKKHYTYSCIGIYKCRSKLPIKIRNWPYTETTKKELSDFLLRKHNDLSAYYKSRGTTMMIFKDGKILEAPNDYKVPYNPIELE